MVEFTNLQMPLKHVVKHRFPEWALTALLAGEMFDFFEVLDDFNFQMSKTAYILVSLRLILSVTENGLSKSSNFSLQFSRYSGAAAKRKTCPSQPLYGNLMTCRKRL